MATNPLENRTRRGRLAPRHAPYAHRLGRGVALLYWKGRGDRGTWKARTPAGGDKAIGVADDVAGDGLTFAEAVALVLERHRQEQEAAARASAPPEERARATTVREALQAYVANAEATKSGHGVATIRSHEKLIVTALGDVRLGDLDLDRLRRWRNGLVTDRRSKSTVNKVVATFKAACTATGATGAWNRLELFRNAGGAREVVFDTDQLRRLVAAAYEESILFGQLTEALVLTGCRYGEIANADVADFGRGVLTVAGKTGRRTMALSPVGMAFFEWITTGRIGEAPLLPRDEHGNRWGKDQQTKPTRRALARAGLDPAACVYTIRHSVITLALYAGVPAAAVAKNVGTSLAMLDRTYSKVLAELQATTIGKLDVALGGGR